MEGRGVDEEKVKEAGEGEGDEEGEGAGNEERRRRGRRLLFLEFTFLLIEDANSFVDYVTLEALSEKKGKGKERGGEGGGEKEQEKEEKERYMSERPHLLLSLFQVYKKRYLHLLIVFFSFTFSFSFSFSASISSPPSHFLLLFHFSHFSLPPFPFSASLIR